MSRNI